MIKNYLKIAWRNALKHKGFSLINIVGLAIGITTTLLIFLYVHNELTFDQYNTKSDRIARVTTTLHAPESDLVLATSPTPLATFLTREYPEVAAAARLEPATPAVKLHQEVFREKAFFKTDQSIFSIFSFEFLEGSAAGALTRPQSIVITASTAKKYFGKVPALGKTIVCNEQNLSVTGVIKDRPENSDIRIDALLSADFSASTGWMDDFTIFTFVLFKQKPNLRKFEEKLTAISKKYIQPELDAMDAKTYHVEFVLEPLSEVHFSKGKLADTPKGNKQFSYLLSMLAILILIIALLNYINLSTAKATERGKEVGIRKVSGAGYSQLVRQFLLESSFLVTIAWILATAFVCITYPFFNSLFETGIELDWNYIILFAGGLFIATILLAGLYPAFVISRFKPAKVLKGSWRRGAGGIAVRKVIVVAQFAIASGLVMGAIVIYQQMRFIDKKDLGFNRHQLLNIYLPRDSSYQSAATAFQNVLRKHPAITGMTIGSGMVEDGMAIGTTFAESEKGKRELMAKCFSVDENFLPVFQIQLVQGRNLSDSFTTDKKEAFLVNEAFVKLMGWKSPIGKSMDGFNHKGQVVGVVKNFYYTSLHNLVEPAILVYDNVPVNTTTVRIKAKDLDKIKNVFKKYFPSQPFNYEFFDDIVDRQYVKDKATMSMFTFFTGLAIFVSCLGLYGLAALIALQRMKEISIRKVLGASINQLVSLLTKEFMTLLVWASLIALPTSGIALSGWLQNYAYHIPLSWWMFIIPVFITLLLTLAVISGEVIKAALVNPVKNLRAE